MKKIFFFILVFIPLLEAQTGEAGKLVDKGYALLEKSSCKDAEKVIFEAFKVSEKEKDNYNKIRSVKLLGTLYYNYRELEAAASFYRLAVNLLNKAFNQPLSGEIETELYNIKNNLAITLMETDRRSAYAGKITEAENLFMEVLDFYEKKGNNDGRLSVLLNLGILYRLDASADPDNSDYNQVLNDALTTLIKARNLSVSTLDENLKTNILFNLGISFQSTGQLDSAAKNIEMSIEGYKKSGNNYWKAIASLRLGYLYLEMSDRKENGEIFRNNGINLLNENLAVIEEYRSKLDDERGRAVFLDNLTYYYVLLINELYENKDFEAMFNLAEKVKSRSFIDMLSTKASGVEENLPAELKEVLSRKSEIETVFRDSLWLYFEEDKIGKFTSLLDEYSKIYSKKEELQPDLNLLVSEETVKLKDFQKLIDEKSAVVEFFIGRNAFYTFLVTRNSITVSRSKQSPREIDSLVTKIITDINLFPNKRGEFTELQKILNRNDDSLDSLKLAEMWYASDADRVLQLALFQLYKTIIGDQQDKDLVNYNRVIIIPHGFLHEMPFAALISSFKNLDLTKKHHVARPTYWIEEKEILTLPSASSLPFLLKAGKTDEGKILIVGNPIYPNTKFSPLPFAEKEANEISRHFDKNKTLLLINEAATESVIKKEAGKYDILHFATHGIYEEDALKSHLMLTKNASDDGYLRASEIFKLKLNANLVVLSACLSGRVGAFGGHKYLTTDDLTGLTRALLYAGAANVMGTLWTVDDRSTGFMMEHFYEKYKDEKKPLLFSMRDAQIAVLNNKTNKDWSHPFYWAPFILIGSPGK
ncbi:MAG: CHAT domain-containing protein [Bacteroidetes bacterium]|nr:CHAT domain-containing protein [Bacteroidota bacterium]